jgi:glycerol-1-phosphate dehydrogenase [NAD(P)+]
MSGAGFGDLLSKNASTADWILSHLLFGDYYCPLAASLAEEAITNCISKAELIKYNHPEGLTVLIDALLRSGISMVMAGSSSPASGGEHLISHLWDMTAHWSAREPALHGEQTGMTTLISLRLYEKLLALEPADLHRLCRQKPEVKDQTSFTIEIRNNFRDIADMIMPFAQEKYLSKTEVETRRKLILSRWENICRSVRSAVIPVKDSRDYLKTAGAAFRISDIGISPDEMVFAYRYARWIRNRYTVLDLAAELGMLEMWEQDVLSVIAA